MRKIQLTILMTVFLVLTQTGCWVTAQEGTVQVRTINDRADLIIRPESGGVYSWNVLWDEYYPVTLRTKTDEVSIQATSKDNAALNIKIAVTYSINNSDEAIFSYIRKFGLDAKTREDNRSRILSTQVNTETKNAIANYDAYSLLANQEEIQKRITEVLKPIFANQLFAALESVQIIDRPDFLDDRIEQAASQVVANQKLKEAASAALEAARIDAEKKQVEAATYANPNLLQIRKLELQKEIAEAWSKHQGTLVLGGASAPNLSLQEK